MKTLLRLEELSPRLAPSDVWGSGLVPPLNPGLADTPPLPPVPVPGDPAVTAAQGVKLSGLKNGDTGAPGTPLELVVNTNLPAADTITISVTYTPPGPFPVVVTTEQTKPVAAGQQQVVFTPFPAQPGPGKFVIVVTAVTANKIQVVTASTTN